MKRLFLLSMVLVMAVCLLASCGGDNTNVTGTTTTTSSATTSSTTTIRENLDDFVDDLNGGAKPDFAADAIIWDTDPMAGFCVVDQTYRIIYEDGNSAAASASSTLAVEIKSAIGVNVVRASGRVEDGSDKYYMSDKEIVIGSVANRNYTSKIQSEFSYIAAYEGNGAGAFYIGTSSDKIYIYAETRDSVNAAVNFFVRNYVIDKDTVSIPNDMRSAYLYDKITSTSKVFNMLKLEDMESKADLLNIRLDGNTIEDFNAATTSYTINKFRGETYPVVSADLYTGNSSLAIVQPTADNNGQGKITVTSADGKSVNEYSITVSFYNYSIPTFNITNGKDGATGIITIVQDDGYKDTTDFMLSVCKANGLKMNIGFIANKFATLEKDSDGKFIIDDDGNFKITFKDVNSGLSGGGTTKYYTDLIRDNSDVIEISSHSYTHGAWGLEENNVKAEILGSQQILQQVFPGQNVTTFVYPGFTASNRAEQYKYAQNFMTGNYVAARSLSTGKQNGLSGTKFLELECASLYYQPPSVWGGSASNNDTWLRQSIERSCTNGGWVVTMNHAISATNSGLSAGAMTIDQAFFNHVVDDYIMPYVNEGKLWSAFFSEAAMYVAERSAASVDCKEYDDKIEIILTDTLDDELYYYPLTVDVSVDSSWGELTLSYFDRDGVAYTEDIETYVGADGKTYARMNIVPDCGTATITQK